MYNEPPAAPTGLATAVQDYQVQLTWNPNTESDVSGYNLYRKGERINAPVGISPEAVTISASFSDYSGPADAFDSNPNTYWFTSITPDGNGGWQPVWWEIDPPSAELMEGDVDEYHTPSFCASIFLMALMTAVVHTFPFWKSPRWKFLAQDSEDRRSWLGCSKRLSSAPVSYIPLRISELTILPL